MLILPEALGSNAGWAFRCCADTAAAAVSSVEQSGFPHRVRVIRCGIFVRSMYHMYHIIHTSMYNIITQQVSVHKVSQQVLLLQCSTICTQQQEYHNIIQGWYWLLSSTFIHGDRREHRALQRPDSNRPVKKIVHHRRWYDRY